MSKWAVAVVCFILMASASYLTYISFTKSLSMGFKFRFFTFVLEHVFTFIMLLYSSYRNYQNIFQQISWMVAFTLGFVISFAGAQIYLATVPNSGVNLSSESTKRMDLDVLGYINFYYQVNIYLAVFFVFSIVMYILIKIHDENQSSRLEEAIQNLDKNSIINATGLEEPCSICLGEYEKEEECYALYCGHIFHKDCLKDWLKQKLSCPLCRNTNLYVENVQQQ